MNYIKRVAIAIDQLAATVFFGTYPDETISAMAHRRKWKRAEAFINWLFRDEHHCRDAYAAEKKQTQNAQEYRDG